MQVREQQARGRELAGKSKAKKSNINSGSSEGMKDSVPQTPSQGRTGSVSSGPAGSNNPLHSNSNHSPVRPKLERKSSDLLEDDDLVEVEVGSIGGAGEDKMGALSEGSNGNNNTGGGGGGGGEKFIDYSFAPENSTGPRTRRTSSADKDEIWGPPGNIVARSPLRLRSTSSEGPDVADMRDVKEERDPRLPVPMEKVWSVLAKADGGSGQTLGQAWAGGYVNIRDFIGL